MRPLCRLMPRPNVMIFALVLISLTSACVTTGTLDKKVAELDHVRADRDHEMIKRTADDFGVTSVVISHDMASTFRIADRVAMLYEGIIVASGTRTEVLAAPSQVLRQFVEPSGAVHFGGGPVSGSSSVNLPRQSTTKI